MIGFYNISESMRITVETFAAVAPQKISVIFAENYEEGIGHIISFKEGKSMSEKLDKKELAIIPSTKQFLQVIARISWLNMLDETVTIPPRNTQYYLFFKAIDSLRCDLLAKEIESKREIQLLQQRYEHRITQMVIQMNAQAETNKKFIHEAEKEATTLKRRIETLESELNRSSTTHSSKLQELLDQIYSVDVSPTIKRTLTDCCSRLIEAHAVEKRLSAELTESDSLFLSQLQKKFPKLNKRELRICMLVKLNYDTAEIAHSVGISTRGTESLRYRVHKKLGLGKHQSIKTYLSEFAIT
ncbi:MAG: helix-turn-helix transcriptional regulator [Chlorobium sp.]